jgi:hypothetical protein
MGAKVAVKDGAILDISRQIKELIQDGFKKALREVVGADSGSERSILHDPRFRYPILRRRNHA